MRFTTLCRTLLVSLLLPLALPAWAQVEPCLKTVSDLSDAYEQMPSKSEVVAIYDYTPISRAVFEPYKYLTYQARTGFIGTSPSGQTPSGTAAFAQDAFNPFAAGVANAGNGNNAGTATAAGIAMGIRYGTSGPEVRFYWWPRAQLTAAQQAPLVDPLNSHTTPGKNGVTTYKDIVGIPLYQDTSGNITLLTDPSLTLAQVIALTTHVRVKLYTRAHDSNAADVPADQRTVDLPCPWRVHTSPTTLNGADAGFSYQSRTFTAGGNTVRYDPWSEGQGTATPFITTDFTVNGNAGDGTTAKTISVTTSDFGSAGYPDDAAGAANQVARTRWVEGTITNTAGTLFDLKVGQFYFTPDFLIWIFGGTQVRYIDPADGQTQWVAANSALLNAANYPYPATSYTGGYAVPDAIKDSKPGWANGLPNMARYQAVKYASINVMLNHLADLQFGYRFLDPTYGATLNPADSESGPAKNPGKHEETKDDTDTAFGGALGVPNTSLALRTIRLMTPAKLGAEIEPVQIWGPRAWDFTLGKNFYLYDVGSPDPLTPEAINYALANTYRQVSNPAQTVFDRSKISAGCANTYVILFPGQGMADSYTAALNGDATNVPGMGNSAAGGNADGNYGTSNNTANITPGSSSFTAGILSSIAAFGTGANTRAWGAPWTLTVNGNTRRIQTIVISVGVPGAYKFKGTNAGDKSPHEQLFRVAQWGDPGRQAWQPSNGSNKIPDLPIQLSSYVTGSALQYTKVYYFTGSDPKTLEEAFNQVAKYIVSAGAALSAPATPATGVRAANAAYFGIFKTTLSSAATTNKSPLWSGRLHALGIRESTEWVDSADHTKGTHSLLRFYGYDPTGNPGIDPTDIATGIPNFDTSHLWNTWDLFGAYLPADITVNGAPSVHTSTGLLKNAVTKWTDRALYTMVKGAKVRWPNVKNPGLATFEKQDPDDVISALKESVYAVDSKGVQSTTTKINDVQALNFIAWIRGAYNANNLADPNNTYNRLDIMGDIVNSAPLAVELTPTGTDALLPSSVSAVLPTGSGTISVPGNPFTGNQSTTNNPYKETHARLIIVGTNVGILEGFFEWSASFNSGTLDAAGQPIYYVDAKAMELWGFIPPEFWQAMYTLFVTRNNTTDHLEHAYMVDGDPGLYHVDLAPSYSPGGTLADHRVSKGEDAVVIFGNRKGSRSYYGLQLSSLDKAVGPDSFKILWTINPQDPTGSVTALPSGMTAPSSADATVIKTMGMSTSVPAVATVYSGNYSDTPTAQNLVFLSGGYSNPEMDACYKATSSTDYGKGMGKLILALNPLSGKIEKLWDLRDVDGAGAIAEGVTPLSMFNNSLTQRLYFADVAGNIKAIHNSKEKLGATEAATGYRLDSAFIDDWLSTPRTIYSGAKNSMNFRFTTRPDAFMLQGGYPLVNKDNINPLSVVVAIGSGDRNNPTDKNETYTIGTTSTTQHPSSQNRFLVLVDRQDSKDLGFDTSGIPDDKLQAIKSDGTGWVSSYSKPEVTPNAAEPYLFNSHYGYRIDLGTGALPANTWSGGVTYDKVLVSPLIKQGLLFFSIFNVSNASGYNCAPNAFTRTFRQCDIMRPLALNLQTVDLSQVGDIQGNVTRTSDSCTGLAFYFNSLSSQLVDAGNRVLQGGALTAGQSTSSSTINTATQAGQNTPSLQNVKDSESVRGIRVRAWRIVR
jgi:hypothetical protein